MRRFGLVIVLMMAAAMPAAAQLGKRIAVMAGTPEDKAVAAINAATTPREKLALIDQFAATHPQGDMALLADQMYVQIYSSQKNYAKVYLYGEKALALDPGNLNVAVQLVRAAQLQRSTSKMFKYGELVGPMVSRYMASPAPPGTNPSDWAGEKARMLRSIQPNVDWVESLLYHAAATQPSPERKIAMLNRFVAAFPNSPRAINVEYEIAAAYRNAGEAAKMVAYARERIAQNPNEIAMRLLLADYWSQKGIELDQASAAADKVLSLLAQPTAPADVSPAKWQQQVAREKGLAHSALGQVFAQQGKDRAAVAAFQQAKPLLKADKVNYARNLYRLGFTLAKLKENAQARAALTEAAALDTPYRAMSQALLRKLPGGRRR
jgi:tetratricopeptide (TPR) repeat protein